MPAGNECWLKEFSKMKQRLRLIMIIVLFTLLVLISPFLTKDTIQSAEELKSVSFGFPWPFVIQDQSQYDPPFPYDASFASPWENPTTIDIGTFIFSLFFVNLIGILILSFSKKSKY
jgi:hypothetical protein